MTVEIVTMNDFSGGSETPRARQQERQLAVARDSRRTGLGGVGGHSSLLWGINIKALTSLWGKHNNVMRFPWNIKNGDRFTRTGVRWHIEYCRTCQTPYQEAQKFHWSYRSWESAKSASTYRQILEVFGNPFYIFRRTKTTFWIICSNDPLNSRKKMFWWKSKLFLLNDWFVPVAKLCDQP